VRNDGTPRKKIVWSKKRRYLDLNECYAIADLEMSLWLMSVVSSRMMYEE
jgi:hypothetical protein